MRRSLAGLRSRILLCSARAHAQKKLRHERTRNSRDVWKDTSEIVVNLRVNYLGLSDPFHRVLLLGIIIIYIVVRRRSLENSEHVSRGFTA